MVWKARGVCSRKGQVEGREVSDCGEALGEPYGKEGGEACRENVDPLRMRLNPRHPLPSSLTLREGRLFSWLEAVWNGSEGSCLSRYEALTDRGGIVEVDPSLDSTT